MAIAQLDTQHDATSPGTCPGTSPGTSPETSPETSPGAATRGVYRRRRAGVLAVLVLVVFALTVVLGRIGAQAELADPVAGHAVVEPGETLWEVAVSTAPDGVDPRRQLEALRQLNGIEGSHVDAWAVILIPAGR